MMLENSVWSYGQDPKDVKQFEYERCIYGVGEIDTWGFDHFLLTTLHNGLEMLAQQMHGYPDGQTEESWRSLLTTHADNAKWCVETYRELDHEISERYDAEYPPDEDWVEKFLNEGILKDNLPEEAKIAQRKEYDDLYQEREDRKNALMDFIKEYLWALWD